jgi:hypothetical protein
MLHVKFQSLVVNSQVSNGHLNVLARTWCLSKIRTRFNFLKNRRALTDLRKNLKLYPLIDRNTGMLHVKFQSLVVNSRVSNGHLNVLARTK